MYRLAEQNTFETDTVAQDVSSLTLEAIVEAAGNLAALPQVVLRLIDLTSDPRACAADIERVIRSDQGVAARVLTLANSTYYGLPRRISSIREGVVFLGFKTVRNLAMTVTAFNMFLGKSDVLSLARRDLWRHSLNVALCTRIVCLHLNPPDSSAVNSEEAFTAGLLHDIGKMAIDIAMPAAYTALVAAMEESDKRMHEIEDQFIPFGHAAIGAAMANKWNLPPPLCSALEFHHTPADAQINRRLVSVVSLADAIAVYLSRASHASSGESAEPASVDESAPEQELCDTQAAHSLRLTAQTMKSIVGACELEMEKGVALRAFC